VPIYYESRLAKLEAEARMRSRSSTRSSRRSPRARRRPDKEKLKTKWAALEAMVGTEKRLSWSPKDLVEHFEKRLEAMDGKAMIVCMSRRICVDLYNEIIKLRPQWHSDDDARARSRSS
jgi:type I restriction enzyme, R subunit